MNNCILCGKLTEGSIGAAGLRWSIICQPCKDSEDRALAERLGYESKAMDLVWKNDGGTMNELGYTEEDIRNILTDLFEKAIPDKDRILELVKIIADRYI